MRWMLAVSLVLLGCVSWACDKPSASSDPKDLPPDMKQTETPANAPATTPAAAATSAPATQASAKAINQFCAVEHDNKIDPKVTIAHEGKTIGFCCEDCIGEFKKDPAKYMASLK